jgi:class 3 adenylate cyclase
METGALIGAIGGIIGILGAVIAYTKFAAQAPLQARITELEGDLNRQQERTADLQGKNEADIAREKERFAELEARYDNLSHDFSNLKRGKGGVVIKNDVDSALLRGMNLLQATESSVLVPGPPPSSSFVFLSIYGRAAASLRYSKLPINKGKAGKVFATGRLDNSADPRKDSEFFEGMDEKGAHTTRTMLTVPLRHEGGTIGVVQFLNKENDREFTGQDEAIALEIADELANKVADFTRETSNFEILGLSAEQEGKEETIVFCDLSASSRLFRVLAAPDAIDCVNEYFERQSEIAMGHDATVDKYMGDGIMLRFAPRNRQDYDHATRAVKAAFQMNADFEALKQSWLNFEYAVEDVYSRIGIASGRVYEAILGHRQHQHITVIGDTVNTAANLCDIANRTRQVILINASAQKLIGENFAVEELPADVQRQVKSGRGPFFEVVGVRDGSFLLAGASKEERS